MRSCKVLNVLCVKFVFKANTCDLHKEFEKHLNVKVDSVVIALVWQLRFNRQIPWCAFVILRWHVRHLLPCVGMCAYLASMQDVLWSKLGIRGLCVVVKSWSRWLRVSGGAEMSLLGCIEISLLGCIEITLLGCIVSARASTPGVY